MTALFCNRCGHKNPDDANFCSSCGAPLDHSVGHDPMTTIVLAPVESSGEMGEEDIVVSFDDVPAGLGVLVVKRGPNAGSRFVLTSEVTRLGRHPESDIFLDDVTVSRRHAEVSHSDGRYLLRDVGSLNGTYLERERIEDDVVIGNGDEIQVGKFRLVFLAEVSGR